MNGSTIYVRLMSMIGGAWQFVDYTYTAALPTAATMITPAPSSALPLANPVAFTWTPGGLVTQCALWVGTAAGTHNLYSAVVPGTSANVNVAATGTIYVRLFSTLNGTTTTFVDYTYTR